MAELLLSKEQQEQIVEAIRDAERNTSGEVKVHVEATCPGDVLERAKEVFAMLNLHQTVQRNGVLFYVASEAHKFAILGDSGIDAAVPDDFWNEVKECLRTYFKQGDFTGGLTTGIRLAGQQLKSHFPFRDDDTNELPDEISFGS